MLLLDRVCRAYQRLYPGAYPEHTRLATLYDDPDKSAFLTAYFDHEYAKGRAMVERFSAITTAWHGGRVLDFGCGAGGLTYRVGERAASAVGIDLDPVKIAHAAAQRDRLKAPHVSFKCYPGGPLPFADGSFDTIFSVDVAEHVPDLPSYFREFRRVLAPGGHLLVSFGPPWNHAHGKHLWHKLPGWWTHLIFPRSVVMRVCGYGPETTYEDLGMQRLSVGRFERVVAASGFRTEFWWNRTNLLVRPLRHVPALRELFIGEVVAVLRAPDAPAAA